MEEDEAVRMSYCIDGLVDKERMKWCVVIGTWVRRWVGGWVGG